MKKTNPIEDIQEIRRMMETSSKFLSLSGLSGVFAGVVALIGAYTAQQLINHFVVREVHYLATGEFDEALTTLQVNLFLVAGSVLILALGGGIVITGIKARKNGQKLVSPVSWRLLRSIMVPLFFGGVFVLGIYYHGLTYWPLLYFIPPAMLIFYGMALLNASKYVEVDIKYLALSEMLLGAILAFFPQYGLIFWALGFGVLHILYGTIMYFKYDYRKQEV